MNPAAERLEQDLPALRERVVDAIDADSPICDARFAGELLLVLRELKPVFVRLGCGDTLQQSLQKPDEAQFWRALLRAADTADTWIAQLISDATC